MSTSTPAPLKHQCLLILSALLLHIAPPTAAVAGDPPPRLFLTPPRIARVREALKNPDSHQALAFQALREKVDQEDFRLFDATETNWNYARSYLATAAAFLYRITDEERYAQIALDTLRAIHDDPDPDKRLLTSGGHLLSRATVGMGYALAWNWSHDAWAPEEQAAIKAHLVKALDAWPKFRHTNLGSPRGSNWVAVCRGGELVMLIASGLHRERTERFTLLVNELLQHIDRGYDDLGVSQEGTGYTSYAGIFLLPAILAADEVGTPALREAARERAWYKQAMYAGSFALLPGHAEASPNQHVYLMSGVTGPGGADEGWASLLLPFVPEGDLPEYLWWYDRHIGVHAQPTFRYEHRRAGAVWSILFHPADVTPRDPTGTWPTAIHGEGGLIYARNRWRDKDDILFSAHADARFHRRGWFQPEATQLTLFAFDTLFLGGPNRNREGRYYSKLLVNDHPGRGQNVGTLSAFTPLPAGFHARIDATAQFQGREDTIEHVSREVVLVYSAPDENTAVLATLDHVRASETMTYTWNVNTGSHHKDCVWEPRVKSKPRNTPPSFTIQGGEGATVRGWILAPDAPLLDAENGFRFHIDAEETEILVLLYAASTPDAIPPAPELIETHGNALRYQLGDARIGYVPGTGTLLATEAMWEAYRAANPTPPE